MSRFRRLTITHAAMMGGDAAMLVALADSLFLSIDPSAARGRVLLFLDACHSDLSAIAGMRLQCIPFAGHELAAFCNAESHVAFASCQAAQEKSRKEQKHRRDANVG